jgi:hypothetical protein
MRFIICEALVRIQTLQNHVNDLALLRQHVLTKIVSGDQVVWSLNDGIVIVMHLYEKYENTATPTSIVKQVQAEVKWLKKAGKIPKTPAMPKNMIGTSS